MEISKKIDEIFYELVGIKSDTGTELELDVEKYLYDKLSRMDYFAKNPSDFGSYEIKSDYLKRNIVWGLIRGNSNDTVILLHHHDVVDALDFGELKGIAYNPNKLHIALKQLKLSKEVSEDLESGKWIFGRGTCDMKAGAAIQLAIIEKYSKLKNFNGNLLIFSVPDEESLSIGMREGAKLLVDLKEKFNLNYSLCINSEPHERENENEGVLHEGSVGKIMPVIYVRGKKSHVGNIFSGFNPVLLLSEISRKIELNCDFSDVFQGEIAPPPCFLNFRDRKERYDVSIPEGAGGYFSVLTLSSTPLEVFNKIKVTCEGAFEDTIKLINENYKIYNEKQGKSHNNLNWKCKVISFTELFEEAVCDSGNDFLDKHYSILEDYKNKINENKMSMQEATFNIIENTLNFVKDTSPRVVISYSPPFYPQVSNYKINKLNNFILNLSDKINEFTSEKWGMNYRKDNYFMGISDMSYFSLSIDKDTINCLKDNMPLWEKPYTIPFEEIEKLNVPTINIGPWGKDLHKVTERVYKEDLLYKTPSIIEHILENLCYIESVN